MFRQILRRNIQSVAEGQDPPPFVLDKQRVRTYANDTVVRLPQSDDEETDKKRMREMALKVAEAIISRDLQILEDLSDSKI